MAEDLAAAVERAEVSVDGPGLVDLLRAWDRLTAKVAVAVGLFDAAGGWELEGATSMTAWLRHHGGLTAGQAGSLVRTAGLLRRLPVTRQAWASGRLSGGQVQAIVANVRPSTAELLAQHEETVVAAVAPLPVADTAAAMQHWAMRADALVDGDLDRERDRTLHVSTTLGGRVELSGYLDAEGGAVVATAVRVATTRDVECEPERTPGERRADALVDVCRWFLDHQGTARGGRRRAHLNVVVDLDDLGARAGGGRLVDGPVLDATTVDRLLCDSALHRVLTAGRSAVLDYGTTTRTVPAPLWSAVVVRDRHCRFPGCDRPPGWCEAHHVTPVAAGGPTSLDNLVLLCTRHHHRCHQPRWHAELRPDGTLCITTPAGRVVRSEPRSRPPDLPSDRDRSPPPRTTPTRATTPTLPPASERRPPTARGAPAA